MTRKMILGKFILFLVVMLISVVVGPCDTLQIYDSLTHCYRGNNTENSIASSLQNLLELIRKVEDFHPASIDMRTLAVSIVQRIRIDGIQKASGIKETEFTIPYGVNGIMAPKFKIILSLISDTPNTINFTEALTPFELCTFHRLVSYTVEPSMRGDESKTCNSNLNINSDLENTRCPTNKIQIFPNGKMLVMPGDVSKCPEESGVVRTFGYGSFAPGVVIGSIAAGLQPQSVQIRDIISVMKNSKNTKSKKKREIENKITNSLNKIDNIYATGLAGDLAEVCVYQTPYYGENVSIGLTGYWDDMHFPKTRYLAEDHYKLWQLTDSEILAGIDAYHLSTKIDSWVQRIKSLRLSQVLEMYYSARGIPTFAIENVNRHKRPLGTFTPSQTASGNTEPQHEYVATVNQRAAQNANPYQESYYDSNRYSLDDTIDSACERKKILERIPRINLKEETYNLAQILQLSFPMVSVDDDLLHRACNAAVDRFFDYAKALLNDLPDCGNIPTSYRRANIDLTMIIDGSRDEYESQKIISVVSEMIDVSTYGSYISVIHGGSSDLLVSRTNSIFSAFEELRSYEGQYPTTLSLSTSLSKVVQLFSLYDTELERNFTICRPSRVVLVLSQTQRITEDDFQSSEWLITGSLQQFPDVYYVFVTNDRLSFEELFRNVTKTSYVLPDQYTVIESSDMEPRSFLPRLVKVLKQIPKRLIVPSCEDTLQTQNDINAKGRFTHFEDYVSPKQANSYQINPLYLHNVPELRVQFEGVGYGTLTICMIRGSVQCQSTIISEVVLFNVSQPCQSNDPKSCSSITFTVELDTSNARCTETDCRYPDQVRYLISLYSTECQSGGANKPFKCAVSLLLVLVLSLLNFY